MAAAERICYRRGIEAALRFLRHEGLKSKKATAANKIAAVAKVEVFTSSAVTFISA